VLGYGAEIGRDVVGKGMTLIGMDHLCEQLSPSPFLSKTTASYLSLHNTVVKVSLKVNCHIFTVHHV